eukprot:TRINITY_DN66548_c0_g1_i1.p1 TRINITY_DN66548_c0_g1~~TRINITY_DN66548_c0_g1_i1.p1  ORF type:complete len:563 (-),score=70.39 TRINITY_DN66548_c0_g1_i1:36-1610(-)
MVLIGLPLCFFSVRRDSSDDLSEDDSAEMGFANRTEMEGKQALHVGSLDRSLFFKKGNGGSSSDDVEMSPAQVAIVKTYDSCCNSCLGKYCSPRDGKCHHGFYHSYYVSCKATTACVHWCDPDFRGGKNKGQHCNGNLKHLCGGCSFCKGGAASAAPAPAQKACAPWCDPDFRGGKNKNQHCNGYLKKECGGCSFCSQGSAPAPAPPAPASPSNCLDMCEKDFHGEGDHAGMHCGAWKNMCGGCAFCKKHVENAHSTAAQSSGKGNGQYSGETSGSGKPYCGVASTLGNCSNDLNYLKSKGAKRPFLCMGYGGPADPCTLNIHNDGRSYGVDKNPNNCKGPYLYLWDEPYTQKKNAEWAARHWRKYVDKWGKINGKRIVSPVFTGANIKDHFKQFFNACGRECSDPSSKYYIHVLGWNGWLGDWGNVNGEVAWIKGKAKDLRSSFGNRPIILINFAYLGAKSADKQLLALNSDFFDPSKSGHEAVFYFSARDYGGKTVKNYLTDRMSNGRTIGEELVRVCNKHR